MSRQDFVAMILLVSLVLLLILGPFFTIWSLNQLFALKIPMSFKSWCASLWLIAAIHGIRITFTKHE